MTTNTYIKCLLFSYLKNPSHFPRPPQILQIRQDKCKQESVFLVHRGCSSAMSLQQLRSVFCTCFADTTNTRHRARVRAQLLKLKKKNKKKPSPKPQAGAGRPLPSLLKAVPEAGWFGRERKTKVCALHTHPPTWPSSSSPFPCLSSRRRLVPATPSSCPLKPPPLPKCTPGGGSR